MSKANIIRTVFSQNDISSGYHLSINQCDINITETMFSHNNMSFGDFLEISQSNTSITRTVFSHNNMISGNLLAIFHSKVNIIGTVFSHNTLSGPYSLLHIEAHIIMYVIECTFEYNVAREDGDIIQLVR